MSKTLRLIEQIHEQKQGKGFRSHLGASIIGKDCARECWYVFHWAKRSWFKSRILRLFDRGNREEPAIIKLCREAGIHVEDVDPVTGKQFRITDHNGHFGGSLDAKIFDAPDYPGIQVLGEFKTHNDKSLKGLRKHGLEKQKPAYWAQVHIYMHYEGLPACIHFNVNKNDDDMEILTIELDTSVAERYIDKARKIIDAQFPPPRISESPGWFQCRWCDFKDICHHASKKDMNCRTCVSAIPIENAEWKCVKFGVVIDEGTQRLGCQEHVEIPE